MSMLCQMYAKMSCCKESKKTVSNYETKLKTEYEGYLGAMPLRLVLIIVVQRSKVGTGIGERGGKGVAVRAEQSLICLQLFCAGGNLR